MKLRSLAFISLAAVWVGLLGISAAQPPPAPTEPPVVVPPSQPAEDDDEPVPGAPMPMPSFGPPPNEPRLNEFHGDDIDSVLRTLARQAKINLVISDAVVNRGGTVTMRVEDKTPREAIDIIVQAKGFLLDEKYGVYFIKTMEERWREPVEDQLALLKDSLIPPLAQAKGEYYRQLVAAGVPAATASELVLKEELTKRVMEPPAAKSESGWKRVEEDSSGEDHRSLLKRLGIEGLDGWLTLGAMGMASLSYLPVFLLHFALAIAVWVSGRQVKKAGEPLSFFPPFLWACATLIGGVFVAALYWLMHHSSLRRSAANS